MKAPSPSGETWGAIQQVFSQTLIMLLKSADLSSGESRLLCGCCSCRSSPAALVGDEGGTWRSPEKPEPMTLGDTGAVGSPRRGETSKLLDLDSVMAGLLLLSAVERGRGSAAESEVDLDGGAIDSRILAEGAGELGDNGAVGGTTRGGRNGSGGAGAAAAGAGA